jgi:hypothetical protein
MFSGSLSFKSIARLQLTNHQRRPSAILDPAPQDTPADLNEVPLGFFLLSVCNGSFWLMSRADIAGHGQISGNRRCRRRSRRPETSLAEY